MRVDVLPEWKSTAKIPRFAGICFIVAAVGMVMGATTRSAYSDNAGNSGNGFTAGSVAVGDNDSDNMMLSLTDAKPGATSAACIKVTYSGSLPSSMRLYGSTSGTGLAQYLTLTVTRGSYTSTEPQFASCTNFTPDATNYIGQGSGVVYKGTLQAFPDDYASGLVDPMPSSPEVWAADESHVYRYNVALLDDSGAQGKTASQTFTWEARNN